MASPTGYSLASYGEMVTCGPRMAAYAAALRKAVFPGCTVIDLGAGFGIFSLLACAYGAGSVIAIEPNDVVDLLGPLAKANGCADRIRVVKAKSTGFADPVQADVIISDLRSCLPLFEGHIAAVADARDRFLAPGGKLIPARDRLEIAIAEDAGRYRQTEAPWLHNAYEVDLSFGHRLAVNQPSKVNLAREQLLSAPHPVGVFDYTTIAEPNVTAAATLVCTRPGTAHGLAIWFDAELAPGIGFSNAPGEPELIYGQTFLPLERPVRLSAGDRIETEVRADLIDGSYVWSWNSRVRRQSAPEPELAFRQSSFHARIISTERLARRAGHYVPPSDDAHAIDHFCLAQFDGSNSLGEIAARLRGRFPERFSSDQAALNHVAALAERYHQDVATAMPFAQDSKA